MDRTHIEETKRQHRTKISPVESSRTKEERQTKEHLEKRSCARDEGGRLTKATCCRRSLADNSSVVLLKLFTRFY